MQLHRFPAPVSALAFSDDGSALAIASSEVEGQLDGPKSPDDIYVRLTSDQEVKPKQMPNHWPPVSEIKFIFIEKLSIYVQILVYYCVV